MMTSLMPTYFISHGGGPWPWMPAFRKNFVNLEKSLVDIAGELGDQPKAILMISGHWEDAGAYRVMHSAQPPMVYDYSGFPPETYDVVYPAPGAPALAERAASMIQDAGLPSVLDNAQGYDHGTFVPAYVMYPEADVPLFQISMRSHYDPVEHFRLGQALAPLRNEGVVIIGSGLSYHNLRMFGPAAKEPSAAFDAWLNDVLAMEPGAREAALMDWESAPFARVCHAQEDHLVPLFTALGAASDATAQRIYHDTDMLGGVTASSWKFT